MMGSEGISSVMELRVVVVGVSSGAVSQQVYPLNFAKLLMASISFGARIQIRIETFVFNVFSRKMINILCYFCVSRPQTKMLFSDRASKILCHHKNRGHKPLSRVLFFSPFLFHHLLFAPPILVNCFI